jgi:hypothetical protein
VSSRGGFFEEICPKTNNSAVKPALTRDCRGELFANTYEKTNNSAVKPALTGE